MAPRSARRRSRRRSSRPFAAFVSSSAATFRRSAGTGAGRRNRAARWPGGALPGGAQHGALLPEVARPGAALPGVDLFARGATAGGEAAARRMAWRARGSGGAGASRSRRRPPPPSPPPSNPPTPTPSPTNETWSDDYSTGAASPFWRASSTYNDGMPFTHDMAPDGPMPRQRSHAAGPSSRTPMAPMERPDARRERMTPDRYPFTVEPHTSRPDPHHPPPHHPPCLVRPPRFSRAHTRRVSPGFCMPILR